MRKRTTQPEPAPDVRDIPEPPMGEDKHRRALVQLLRDAADAIEKWDYLKPEAIADVLSMVGQLARTSGDAEFVYLIVEGAAGALTAIRKAISSRKF